MNTTVPIDWDLELLLLSSRAALEK